MAIPLFSLVYTSVRAGQMAHVVKNWTQKSARKDLEWVISVDGNRPETVEAAKKLAGEYPNLKYFVQPQEPFTCVRGWNLAAEKSTGKILIAVADDFDCPEAWDEKLLALAPAGWEDGDYVVHIDDGYVKTLCTLAILTRKRYEKFGYLWYPGYLSLFCDTEFGEVAARDGVIIEAMHLLFEHMHPDCGKRGRDQADLTHASSDRWRNGEILFNFRKFKGFPTDMGPKAEQAEQGAADGKRVFAAYMQVNQDDFCLDEVCLRLVEEGVQDFFFAIPDHYWTGAATTERGYAEISAVAYRLRADERVKSAAVKIFRTNTYKFPGDNRLAVETRLRNDSLNWVRKSGFKDILIADGDELWKRGTLDKIRALIEQGSSVVSSAMIPVIGLPGYPIGGATDSAVVYIGEGVNFKSCRTPVIAPTPIHEPCVIHFTGTRRTMQEIIDKHRASGHYDDPEYAFELWIKDVLPNIAPGFTYKWPSGHEGLHMFLPYQIWSRIRNWLPDELTEIPSSLHSYLGQPADSVIA